MTLGPHPLTDGLPPSWATEWGEDRFGPFVAFSVGNVVQRLRWVPPGRFLMGSPEDEEGRYEDEGPQHEVELIRGLWLGETPVTQALWAEVMGSNPSRFVTAERPVEQVSWEDCQQFLERLNQRVVGLDARLPTEAEWERACRAGTTTATWLGDLDLKGACNAPLLDLIAWYGGNSGVEFELENGQNSSDWPEKQYDHLRAGTHPVGQKAPNPLGLLDMLGNVFEWCGDWKGANSGEFVVDQLAPPTDSNRVVRGGSWNCDARIVRAARGHWYHPGYRYAHLGFRLAGGQGAALKPGK